MSKNNSSVPIMIVAAFFGFIMFIGYMVYQAFQEDVNLVREDYYQESTRHDQHVSDMNRSKEADIKLTYDKTSQVIRLQLPNNMIGSEVDGNILFYRPSNSALDFTVPIVIQNGEQILSTESIEKGKWRLKATFTYKSEQYFKETHFVK